MIHTHKTAIPFWMTLLLILSIPVCGIGLVLLTRLLQLLGIV